MANDIKCPKCGQVFDVEAVIASDLEEKLKKEYEHKLRQSLDSIQQDKLRLQEDQRLFEDKKKKIEALKTQLEAYTKQLTIDKQNRQKLLTETRGDEANYQRLLSQAKAQLAG